MSPDHRVPLPALGVALALVAATAIGIPGAAATSSPAAPPMYPEIGRGTHLFDHGEQLAGFVEPAWYEANIPFVDLPDQTIEDTYYYRWRTYKEALKYTGPDDGWIVSEFLGPVGYSAPNGGIVAAAGHHVYEGRWLRDPRYLDDYLDYWLKGSGSGPKPATDGLNENTTDWAHQYSFWAADAMLARASVDGRFDFAVDRLPELEEQWKTWAPQFDQATGLYWQVPVWDAMEFTASSYQSDDPYHGGAGYRPTLNAYQYGDAKAIASLLRLSGDRRTADAYERDAKSLQSTMEQKLWDPTGQFYKHVMRDDNPGGVKIANREEIGFVPWYFHMAPAANSAAWAQLTDPQGFAAPFGPTTVERRSPWFMHDALAGCCRWDGPSWPYATSQTLTAMANLLDDYPAQSYVDKQDYYDVLHGYAATQRKNGAPYVAEAHHPDEDRWIYDGAGHSEDYNHSTFNDLVLSGLLGIRPQQGDRVRVSPLVPEGWDHFAVENVPYHGHNLSVAYDRDGRTYGQGAGLRVWVDGVLVHKQSDLRAADVRVPSGKQTAVDPLVDDLANVSGTGFPAATASYTWRSDSPADAIDGQDFHLDVPATRWTTYGSPNREDWLAVDIGTATPVSDVRVSFYDDGGGVRTPDAFVLEYRKPDGTWAAVPGQARTPAAPVRGQVSRVVVSPPVTTAALRIRPTRTDGGAVGITALQSWRPEDSRVTASLKAGDDGLLHVKSGATTNVSATIRATSAVTVRPSLQLPAGWTADPVGPRLVTPGRPVELRWKVKAPANLTPGSRVPVRLSVSTVRYGRTLVTSDVVQAESTFDPADFRTVVWDDGFDSQSAYRIGARFGEPAPTVNTSGGSLVATAADRQSSAVLVAPVTAPAGDVAVVLTPSSFSGASPEDSVLLGLGNGPDDLVLAWYNNNGKASGVDVRVEGRDYGDSATGGCCADVTWAPGDRFAVVFGTDTMTSWLGHGTTWTRLRVAPYGTAVTPERRTTWSPAIGVRLTTGSLALDRMTVLGR
ncbi:MGH1-like glycoside hydrolase domain-containing protein [Umezawaea sp. Da 62-37]|uniref:MGH1-like glycoside hydrolase domain-containing protein n=1 Tax=Umezawaea sp. Da 62-37 TaxID=3075927 RepID=UPI0028F6F176|nr:discoidin domain-containing protein [Umezawaea sp. Da 62-37]WNV86859.1 discoidin domain-containing protein [Umezawaea sp. Da 62-37]